MSAAAENANEGSNPLSCKNQPMAFCSVCLDAVEEGVDRSIAKLKCGHHFHLDCIGSAFNAKGRMQCPNCRQEEQGQWLYANACFLHEDFVDDLTFEEDAEVYSAAAHLQFGHTPWCPHQGSNEHFSLTFEELDNFANGHLDPLQNIIHGLTAPAMGSGQICPYLVAAQSLPLGVPLNHVGDFIALHVDHFHGANRDMRDTSNGLQAASATSASSSLLTSYGGPSQSYNPNGRFSQPSARHLTLGFLVGSSQSAHAGSSQGTSVGGHSGHPSGQLPHIRNAQGSYGNPHPHPMNLSRNRYVNTRRTRHGDILPITQRTLQVYSSQRVQMSEPVRDYRPWATPNSLGQSANQVFLVDAVGDWATDGSHIDPWTRGVFPPQISYGTSSHWWAWLPPETNHGQRAIPNMASNSYHEGRFFGAPRPAASLAGFSEQALEGSYAWVFSGF